jgi:hypothetical protein
MVAHVTGGRWWDDETGKKLMRWAPHRCEVQWGSITMTETVKRTRSDDPIKNGFGRSRGDSQFAPKSGARFRTARLYLESEGSLPLFLSGPTDDSRPTREATLEQDLCESGRQTSGVSRRVIAAGALAVFAVAVVCVVFSLQDRDRRAVIAHATASLSAAQMMPIDRPAPTREAISAAFKAAVQTQLKPDQPAPTP